MEDIDIFEIATDHLDEIKKNIWVEDESQANSYQLLLYIYSDGRFRLEKSQRGGIYYDQYPPDPNDFRILKLACMNIYEYVDNPNNHTDEENIDSFMNSYQVEDEILQAIDDQLDEVS